MGCQSKACGYPSPTRTVVNGYTQSIEVWVGQRGLAEQDSLLLFSLPTLMPSPSLSGPLTTSQKQASLVPGGVLSCGSAAAVCDLGEKEINGFLGTSASSPVHFCMPLRPGCGTLSSALEKLTSPPQSPSKHCHWKNPRRGTPLLFTLSGQASPTLFP